MMRKNSVYRNIMRLDDRCIITTKFKLWFNEAIHGYQYNTEYRSNRKYVVKPFEVPSQ